MRMSSSGEPTQDSARHSRTIVGVPTSVTAFVGYTSSGPVETPQRFANFSDVAREFGQEGELVRQVQQFFLNGGTSAWIARIASEEQPPDALELIGEPSHYS